MIQPCKSCGYELYWDEIEEDPFITELRCSECGAINEIKDGERDFDAELKDEDL